tara:strand:- start:58 stop:936 length:879 start_codon:yes stop_codon:yes gene_type:complete
MKILRPFIALAGILLWLHPASAEDFRPNLGPDLATITVRSGDLTLLLRQGSQWTPGRIDFQGTAMTTERSAYGTVFSFPDVGFIGTGHLENEPEDLQSLKFFLNGKSIEPAETLTGQTFRFERVSRIRGFSLTSVVELKDNRLYETATVANQEAIPLKLIYHFMHAWTPTVSSFLAGNDSVPDEVLTGELRDEEEESRKFYIQSHVDWIAVFEPERGHFAVSRILETPELGDHLSMIWNVPGTYRKYYLKCFQNETVPAGFNGTWRMVTGFGEASSDTWQDAARQLANKLGR